MAGLSGKGFGCCSARLLVGAGEESSLIPLLPTLPHPSLSPLLHILLSSPTSKYKPSSLPCWPCRVAVVLQAHILVTVLHGGYLAGSQPGPGPVETPLLAELAEEEPALFFLEVFSWLGPCKGR